MAQRVSELMASPVTIPASATLVDAAKTMRERNIGDVVVAEGDLPLGVLTDRDIVVRAIADGLEPARTPVSELCSGEVVAVGPGDDVSQAVRVMRDRDVRRLPVVAEGRLVGVICLGDLATGQGGTSPLVDR